VTPAWPPWRRRAAGVTTSLDTNLRLRCGRWNAPAKMAEAFRLCDVCLPSWEDVSMLTGLD
jgi:2-dehydro-3-deoxygluconokinase